MEYIYVYTCASMIMKIGKKCSCDITDDAKKIGQKLRTFMLYVHFGVH